MPLVFLVVGGVLAAWFMSGAQAAQVPKAQTAPAAKVTLLISGKPARLSE
jgi:hypothetical protein